MKMLTKNQWSESSWQDSEEKFNRVHVGVCDCDCYFVLMVNLVNVLVDTRPVQNSMKNVKAQIFTEHAKYQLKD